VITRTRDGSTWRIGTAPEVAWIANSTSTGRTITAAIPPVFEMVREVHDKARDRWLDHDNTTDPLNADEISRALSEAYQATTMASTYIDKAVMGLLDSGGHTPF
jgi:hypothetical protein